MYNYYSPHVFDPTHDLSECGLLILSAGFEDRDYAFLDGGDFDSSTLVVLVHFKSPLIQNEMALEKFKNRLSEVIPLKNLYETEIDTSCPQKFQSGFTGVVTDLPLFNNKPYVDVSGFPAHAICSVLHVIRQRFPTKSMGIVYSSAEKYFPTHKEYLDLIEKLARENESPLDLAEGVAVGKELERIDFLPPTMALEMSDNYIPKTFMGHRSQQGYTCLVVFAGYEVHRSGGAIDNINPGKLVLMYGRPGESDLGWRVDLSRQLHKKYEQSMNCAVEFSSTLNMKESLNILEEYYNHLFDDHDFAVSPVCSKMQSVATYLFWEKYPEVQLVFPQPIGFDPERAPQGVGQIYLTYIPAKSAYHR